MRPTPPSGAPALRAILAAIPIAALSVAVPLANRIEPRLFGMPFFFCWIVGWTALTPAFIWTIGRLDRRW
ncbi:MAG TPA: DUF3311 domain-containing protein [Candidatus Cybelea sp.]|jgi:hypothetical protein|nr:DUF3311 domain-containing protein [Candidatus Cybelea sp.]